jgi:hypothetical protein
VTSVSISNGLRGHFAYTMIWGSEMSGIASSAPCERVDAQSHSGDGHATIREPDDELDDGGDHLVKPPLEPFSFNRRR